MKIRIGTRGSRLALVQTEYVRDCLKKTNPQHEYEIVVIKTKGDLIQNKPLDQIGGKGLFVKEIEKQILSNQIQMGVHSMKDMPAMPEKGLVFSKSWKREDPRDVLILREKSSLEELPQGAVIGTGSMRRALQLKAIRPDLNVVDIRGNVDTRLRKMQEQGLDGIVLAAAGLKRLGMEYKITCYLETKQMISAPAQGILALEVREDNKELLELLDAFHDPDTQAEGIAERTFLKLMGGDCHTPVGACCEKTCEGLRLHVVFGKRQGEQLFFAQAEGKNAEALAKSAARKIREQMAGKVYLVGGGPGDVGLLTLRGKQVLEEADCIIYDRLVSPELLAYAKDSCEKIYVGKESHNHTMQQEDMNLLLVEKAMEYEKVVRLKGGDVYVFGRGGEEALTLREYGISFEIVPGISSAIAGLAYGGIPITHRGLSTGFHVVTAHNRKDELADIDFSAMAKGRDTCVFLMGLGKLGEIAQNLIKAGMSPEMETAVISCAARPDQKVVVSDLAHIEDEVLNANLKSPAIIVVGRVVKLRQELNFFEEKPLFGKKYLLPKIGDKPSKLTAMLEEQGAAVTELKVGQIEILEQDITKEAMAQVNRLVFTSANGVNGFFQNLMKNGMDTRNLGTCKIAVIGRETEKHLKQYGIMPDFKPEIANSESLCNELSRILRQESRQQILWYPKVENDDHAIAENLGKIIKCVELPVYRNNPVEINTEKLISGGKADGIIFTCASSAERTIHAMRDLDMELERMQMISIGKKCSDTLKKLGIEHYQEAKKPSYYEIVSLLKNR